MSILEIIKEIHLRHSMIIDFIYFIEIKKCDKLYQELRLESKMLQNILANIAAEKNSYDALIYASSIQCDMNVELTILMNSYGNSANKYVIKSPLYWACYHKNLRMLKFLIDSGVNLVHISRSTSINNPLFIAIEKGFYEGVKLLFTNNFRYTKISSKFLANFDELLQDSTIAAFNREVQIPFQIETVQIVDFLLNYQQNRYESFLGDEHQGFLRYIRNRSFVHVKHSFLQSYSNIPRLYSVERTEKGDIVWTNCISKRKTRYYLQKFHKISLFYEILCNEDLTRTIFQYI